MSDNPCDSTSSFGDPNAQPPSPQRTPTSPSLASPVCETPRPLHGSFTDLGGSTPRFAEEYSVFNATPGNLRGPHDRFPDFVPSTPSTSHKRLLSAEGFALEIATHANHFAPNPNLPLVDPSRRVASSPGTNNSAPAIARETTPEFSPSLNKARSAKKICRGAIAKDQESHIISPPPTVHKGEQKLTPNLNMQHGQSFHQPDFSEGPQTHNVTTLMANSGDLFSYPLSAPAEAPSLWDPQASMAMEFDFSVTSQAMFPSSASGHRHIGSFDWNNNVQLFQDATMPPHSSNQHNTQPPQQGGNTTMDSSAYHQQLEDPFQAMAAGQVVDPLLLLGQPNEAVPNFDHMEQTIPANANSPAGKITTRPVIRRTGSSKTSRASKAPDRALASSPLKHSRTGVDHVEAGTRGRWNLTRSHTMPILAPAPHSVAQLAGGSSAMDGGRSVTRPSGRISPVKNQRRLSSLASIRESSPAGQRASVRLTIDSRGRARAETMMTSQGHWWSECTRDLPARSSPESLSENESTDDEPIIIPSRNNSFSASFALPDPRQPVGSIFHRPRRSTSDRSSSSAGGDTAHHDGDESEAETVHRERRRRSGDAESELVKLVESRQRRHTQAVNMRPGRLATNWGNFPSDTVSPSSLAESGYCTDNQGIRCICKRSGSDKKTFMVQCESCEMWLHGKCIGFPSKRTMTNVYICAFCSNTAPSAGRGVREEIHVNALGIATSGLPGS